MPVREILPTALRAQLSGLGIHPVLLDVRTPAEHALVALPGALNLPRELFFASEGGFHSLDELRQRVDQARITPDKPVVAYCHSGVRSLHAAAFLASRGVEAVSLAGGIDRYAVDVDPSLPRY